MNRTDSRRSFANDLKGLLVSKWTQVRLQDLLAEPTRNGIHKGVDWQGRGTPLIKMGEVYSAEYIGNAPRDLVELTPAEMERLSVRDGDLLFCRTSLVADGVGRCALVQGLTTKSAFASNLIRVRIDPMKADTQYIHWLFRSPEGQELRRSIARGTSVTTITGPDLASLSFHLPPIGEQRAIAGVLGALDDKIESNRRIVATSMAMSETSFLQWRGSLTGQEETTFGAFADVFGGATPSTSEPEYWGGGHVWIAPRDVTGLDSVYLFDSERHITDLGLARSSTTLHPPGSIFMTSRATIGAFAINQVPCAPNQGFIVVRPRDPTARWFLFHEMRSRIAEMQDRATGTTFRELSRGSFREMTLSIPAERASFVALDNAVAPVHARASAAARESQSLTAFRDALLPELLSGRLRLKDAENVVEGAL